MINKRGYATKLDYQETREDLEKYVIERGCVPRERAMEDVLQVKHTQAFKLNTGQVGQLIKYSRARGVLTSFTHNGQYFITTLDKMNEFTKGNWKEVNEKAREPTTDNFLTGIIKRGKENLRLESIRRDREGKFLPKEEPPAMLFDREELNELRRKKFVPVVEKKNRPKKYIKDKKLKERLI